MSSATPVNRKIIMQTSALKSQKTSGGLSDIHLGDWKKRGRIRVGTLHLVSCHFQGLD